MGLPESVGSLYLECRAIAKARITRYDKAREIMHAQDEFCGKVLRREPMKETVFPEELQYEAAVDVLRGKVKVLATLQ